MVAARGEMAATKGAKIMTRNAFLLTLVAFLASTTRARGGTPGVVDPPPQIVPVAPNRPPRGGDPVRPAPAPLLGAGLPAILAAGAALAGYRLWRRQRRRDDD
jgi:hypothetical protein